MSRKTVAGSDSPGICRENTGIMFPSNIFPLIRSGLRLNLPQGGYALSRMGMNPANLGKAGDRHG